MEHNEFSLQTPDGRTLVAQSWLPAGPSRCTLALVHGFGEHAGRYTYLIDHLVAHNIAVFGFDQQGHGRSDGKRGYVKSTTGFRQDLDLFLTTVEEAKAEGPLFLFGHSMGGLIVLDYVLNTTRALDGLITSSALLAQPNLPAIMKFAAKVLLRIKPAMSVDSGLDVKSISRDPAEVERYVADPLVHGKGTPALSHFMEVTVEAVQRDAGKLTLPLLMLCGDADPLVPYEGTKTFFANAGSADKTLKIYAGNYHELHNDLDREQLFADETAWLLEHC